MIEQPRTTETTGKDAPIVHVLMGLICIWHRREAVSARDDE